MKQRKAAGAEERLSDKDGDLLYGTEKGMCDDDIAAAGRPAKRARASATTTRLTKAQKLTEWSAGSTNYVKCPLCDGVYFSATYSTHFFGKRHCEKHGSAFAPGIAGGGSAA